MNLADILIIAVLSGYFIFLCFKKIKNRKSGNAKTGCGCSGCSGACASRAYKRENTAKRHRSGTGKKNADGT